MKKSFLLFLTFLFTISSYSQHKKWEVIQEFENFMQLDIESFSLDTFVVSKYYSTTRNENFTWEWSIHLTPDRGETWTRVYQDSTGIEDIPRQPDRIQEIEVNDHVLSMIRDDGYFLTTYDYGETWDSILVFEPYERTTHLTSFGKYIACFAFNNNILLYDIYTKDTSTINCPYWGDVIDLNLNDNLNLKSFRVINDSTINMILSIQSTDTSYSFLYYTTNWGKSWDYYQFPKYYQDVIQLEDGTMYACGSTWPNQKGDGNDTGVIEKSTDNGKTWLNLYSSNEFNYILEFERYNEVLYATTNTEYMLAGNIIDEVWSEIEIVNFEDFFAGGKVRNIECDNNGNCLSVSDSRLVSRSIDSKTTIVDSDHVNINELNLDYDVYSINGNQIEESENLPSGVYFKVYKDKNNNYVRTEKLIITK